MFSPLFCCPYPQSSPSRRGSDPPVLQEIWQHSPRRHLDLPFSHHREAFPSPAAGAVKQSGETPTQTVSLMDCAGNQPEGVCPIAVCAQLRGQLFSLNHKTRQITVWEIKCLTSPISRRLLCGEDHRVLRTPPAVSQPLVFEGTGRYGKVLANPLGFSSAIPSYGTVCSSACFLA